MTAEDEEPFIARSYRRLVSRVQIPGFRPGKAPRSIVESHLGRPALVHEALEFMVPETLDQILKQEDLQAFMEPELEILEVEPVSFRAVVPLEPVVELGDMRSIELEREPVEITDEQVNEIIERLQWEAAPWEPVDRPVQFGDLLTLNTRGSIGGEEAINDEGIDFIPRQDSPVPIPGFSVYLEGMVEGQEKQFDLTVPEEHHQPEFAGKVCHLHVQVLSIKEKKLPELDDEFSKGVLEGYETMELLNDYLRQQLTEAAENASQRQAEQDGLEELLRISKIQASNMIYQRELDNMYEERERAVRNQRLDMDTYLRYIGTTGTEWREQLRPQAEQRLNTYLVVRKLAQDEGLEVDTDEIQAEIDSMVETSGNSSEAMRQMFSSEHAQESIRSSLLSRKVLGRLVEIIEGRGEAPASDTAPVTVQDQAEALGPDVEVPDTESDQEPAPTANQEGASPDAE
jgi:trigger factor